MVSLKDCYLFHSFFLINTIDLPEISNGNSKTVLFADDMSRVITNPHLTNFKSTVIKIFQDINIWFSTRLLSLNIDKTHFMQ